MDSERAERTSPALEVVLVLSNEGHEVKCSVVSALASFDWELHQLLGVRVVEIDFALFKRDVVLFFQVLRQVRERVAWILG